MHASVRREQSRKSVTCDIVESEIYPMKMLFVHIEGEAVFPEPLA